MIPPSRQPPVETSERVLTPPVRKRLPTPTTAEDENVFVTLPPVKPREAPERKFIKIELAKAVPLPPSTPPSKFDPFDLSSHTTTCFSSCSACSSTTASTTATDV